MILKLRSALIESNPWLEQDRSEQRKLLVTAVIFTSAVLFGFGLLVYGLIAG